MSLAIDQALVTAFIAGAFGLPIAHENESYDPVSGTAYAKLEVMQNDETPFSLTHSNQTDGVFRVVLRYPAGEGAIAAKAMADTVFSVFRIGRRFQYNGVSLTIMGNERMNSSGRLPGAAGWYELTLSMPYRAFTTR